MSSQQLRELNSFVAKFVGLWQNGIEANLHVSSRDGQAFINLQAGLGKAPQSPFPQYYHHYQHVSPSRLRRRKRREEERKQAEEFVPVVQTEEVFPVVQTEEVVSKEVEEDIYVQTEEAVHVRQEECLNRAENAVARPEDINKDTVVNVAEKVMFDNDIVDDSFVTETGNIPQIDGHSEITKGGTPVFQHTPYCYQPNCKFCEINPSCDLINERYQCDICQFHSKTASGLNKHKRTKHNKNNVP